MKRLAVLLLVASATAAPTASFDDEMLGSLNAFASAYNQFGDEWRQGGFDLRLAKKLSKLWRDVEKSGAWPKEK